MQTQFAWDHQFHCLQRLTQIERAKALVQQAIEAQQLIRFHMAAEHDHHLTPLEAAYAANALDEVRAS